MLQRRYNVRGSVGTGTNGGPEDGLELGALGRQEEHVVQGRLDNSQHFNSFALAKILKEEGGCRNKNQLFL